MLFQLKMLDLEPTRDRHPTRAACPRLPSFLARVGEFLAFPSHFGVAAPTICFDLAFQVRMPNLFCDWNNLLDHFVGHFSRSKSSQLVEFLFEGL
jgi:hypothetical protein